MSQLDHLEALHLLREDPRVIERSIKCAHQLRAEAYADAWRRLRGFLRKLIRRLSMRRRNIATDPSERCAQAKS